jgi:hypothetical protein
MKWSMRRRRRPKEPTTMQLPQQRYKAIVLHKAVPLHGINLTMGFVCMKAYVFEVTKTQHRVEFGLMDRLMVSHIMDLLNNQMANSFLYR